MCLVKRHVGHDDPGLGKETMEIRPPATMMGDGSEAQGGFHIVAQVSIMID